MIKTILPLLLIMGTFSCQKSDCGFAAAADAEQIVFGVSYAECVGDCSQNYRLTTSHIFADDCDYCYIDHIGFQFMPLEDEKFQIAKNLLTSIPWFLFTRPDNVFGCPGCYDEGAYLLEITRNGVKHVYRWSEDYTDVPLELRPYFEKVQQTLREL